MSEAGLPRTFHEIRDDSSRAVAGLVALFVGVYVSFFLVVTAVFWTIFAWTWPPPAVAWKGALGLGLLTAAGHALLAWIEPIGPALKRLGAVPPDPADRYHLVFRNVLEEIVLASPLERVEAYVLPTTAANAMALADRRRSAVAVTEGAIARLRRDELQAVVAHEVAHLVHGDTRAKTFAYHSVAWIEDLSAKSADVAVDSGDGRVALPLLLFSAIAWVFGLLARLTALAVSRSRETRADASAVEFTRDPTALASALHKFRSAPWPHAPLEAPLLLVAPAGDALARRRDPLAAIFSTHPPVEDRIAALLAMVRADLSALETGRSAPRPLAPADPEAESAWRLHVDADGAWTDPLPLAALLAHAAFGPEAWVAPAAGGDVVRAADVEVLRALLEAHTGAGGGRCPRCRVPLHRETYEGAPVERCPFCRGALLGAAVLPRILARRDVDVGDEARALARRLRAAPPPRGRPMGAEVPLPCPRCASPLVAGYYSYAAGFVVDRCHRCDVAWFDRGEIELAQALAEPDRTADHPSGP